MSFSLSSWFDARFFKTGNNAPLTGGKIYTYLAGTTTPVATYSNDSGTTNTNPIILDADGRANIYLDDSVAYRFILKDANDVTQKDVDNIRSSRVDIVQKASTIADLRLLIGTSANSNAVATLGYYVAGDGGGNTFYWDSTSGATDNWGTVIKPTAVSGAGRWIAVNTTTFTAEQFGAYGDGVHDDTAAINKAIAVLSASGGGVLNFDGIYRLTENSTGSTQTRFTISSDNVTLAFSSRTKFLVKSDSATTIIFALTGVSYFKTIGTLRVESDASTPYSTSGAYGAKALVIYNANGVPSEHITIDKVLVKRGSGGVFIQNAYSASNRVTNISIGEIRTFDVTYGFNAQNNGDGVDIGLVYTYNAYRSYFVYGCESHRAKVVSRSPNTGGTPVNITRYSAAEGGSNTNSENIDIDLEVIGGSPIALVTMRHIGDGGATQVIKNINLRLKSNLPAGTSAISLQILNFDVSGGSASATPFAAKIQDVFVYSDTLMPTDIIGYLPSSWVTKPNIVWLGSSGTTVAKAASLQAVFDLFFHQWGSKLLVEDLNIANNKVIYGLSNAGAQLRIAGIDSSNNTLIGASSAAAVATFVYAGSNGAYFNVNGTSCLRVLAGDLRPVADGTYNCGVASYRFANIYATSGVVNTSDEREKQQVRTLSEAERSVAVRLKGLIRTFKFNDAVAAKGDAARIHVGVMAQEVKAAFEAEGLMAENYAVFCYDEWGATPEIIEPVVDEDGNDTGEEVIVQHYRAAGSRYGIRYEELLAFIISAL